MKRDRSFRFFHGTKGRRHRPGVVRSAMIAELSVSVDAASMAPVATCKVPQEERVQESGVEGHLDSLHQIAKTMGNKISNSDQENFLELLADIAPATL